MFMISQYTRQQPTPGKNRISSSTQAPHGLPPHFHAKHRQLLQDATAEDKDFPTAPLDDDIWLEDPLPDRHQCIHEQSQPHYQCSYPCPYSLELPHFSPEDAPPH